MKEILSIVLVIIGALIGAGFASGQEIYSFFYAYGEKGIIGIIQGEKNEIIPSIKIEINWKLSIILTSI